MHPAPSARHEQEFSESLQNSKKRKLKMLQEEKSTEMIWMLKGPMKYMLYARQKLIEFLVTERLGAHLILA
jgi:hypothetical protein